MPKRAITIPAHRFTMEVVILPHAMDVQTQWHATTVRHSQWRTGLVFIQDVRMRPRVILMGLLVATTAPVLIPAATIPRLATSKLLLDVMTDLACTPAVQTLQHAIGMKWRVVTMAAVLTQDARQKDFAITMPRRVATTAVVKTSPVLGASMRRLATSVNTRQPTMEAAIFHAMAASMTLRATTTKR